MNKKVCLAIQGGGVRGAFSSGVLDVFIENNITFPYVLGVSAGVLNACNYVSKDIGRSLIVCRDFMHDKRFYSRKNLVKYHSYFNFNFLFRELDKELPFNYDEFLNTKTEIVAVASRCEDAEIEYFYKSKMDLDKFFDACAASASIPGVSKKIVIDGKEYLDGGVLTPLPIQKVFEDGYEKVIVILSRPKGFRKRKSKKSALISKLPAFCGKKYAKFRKSLNNSYQLYNDEMDYIESLDPSKVFLIYPETTYGIKVKEKNADKVNKFYEDGRRYALEHLEEIKKFINE